jgi:DNA-binding transcriptional ArsR family regulator
MSIALDPIFAALANPTRRAILERLMAGEASAGDLAAPFALSQPTISSHLKVLEAAGLVTRGRHANVRPVRLEPQAIAAVDDWIGQYRALWEARLDQLETYARELEAKDTRHDKDTD